MARGLRGGPGGILALVDVIEDPERRAALEYDLLAIGLKLDWLGTDRLDWRDLLVVLEQSPSDSASSRRQREGWTDLAFLLATVADKLEVLIWQQTEDGAKGRNQPEPIPRPGVKASADKDTIGKTEGFETADEIQAWYDSRFKKD